MVATRLMASLPKGHAPAAVDIAWCDHGLRDVAEDERIVQEVARAIGARLHVMRASGSEIANRASQSRRGLQAAARTWRYEAVAECARENGYDLVLTGHTASDQVETVLHGMLSSGGASSQAGMRIARELHGMQLVRPLLNLTRRDITRIASELDVAWSEDPSNAAISYRRNLLRQQVLPVLETAYPGAAVAIERTRRMSDHHATVEDALSRAWCEAHCVRDSNGALGINVQQLIQLPAPARLAVIASWLRQSGAGRSVTERVIHAIDTLATGLNPHGEVAVGRACVRRARYHLTFIAPISPPEDSA